MYPNFSMLFRWSRGARESYTTVPNPLVGGFAAPIRSELEVELVKLQYLVVFFFNGTGIRFEGALKTNSAGG